MDQRRAKARARFFPQQEPTKFQVAREFGFSEDVIRKVVYTHYLIGDGQPYVCAGDLISDLIDYEAGGLEVTESDEDVTATPSSIGKFTKLPPKEERDGRAGPFTHTVPVAQRTERT